MTSSQAVYATENDVLLETSSGIVSTTMSLPKVRRNARTVSRRIDKKFGSTRPIFTPYYETRSLPIWSTNVNTADNLLALSSGLLALSGAVINGTTLTVGTNVEAYSADGLTPYRFLRLLDWGSSWFSFCSDDPRAPLRVTLTGWWGIHRDYANAFQPVDALAAAITTTTATTFTVADADGADFYGITPRFSPGSLVRIDDELIDVTLVDTTTNTLTGIRGANGTTPATHAISTVVSVFQVEEPIRNITAKQAALLTERAGHFTTIEVVGMSELRYPSDLLAELRGVLDDYAYDN